MADNGHEGIVLASLPGKSDHCYVPRIGFHFHLHCTAPGKALLAYLPGTLRQRVLSEIPYEAFTSHTYPDPDSLNEALEQYNRQGYSIDVGEYVEGVNCVSACIPWEGEQPLAAIWITALSIELPEMELPRYARKVIATARDMAVRLRNATEDQSGQLMATIENGKTFIELHFLNEETIHNYIADLGISEKWFRTAFRAKYGLSPLKFRQKLIFERAQRLLRNTRLSIKEIAFQLGYDNQNYFSRAFKVHLGQSPQGYRESAVHGR